MPVATKRRKLAVPSKNTAAQGGINTFARVSKATTTTKAILEKNNYVDTIAITLSKQPSTNERKRKLGESEDVTPITIQRNAIKPIPQRNANKPPITPKAPQTSIFKSVTPALIETPTKGAQGLFDRLSIVKTVSPPLPLNDISFSSSFDTSTPPIAQPELPSELLDIINLHSSFLTALSIHYAHNGSHSPADLRLLCPDVARAWGKRRVLLEDIRRSLGVLNSNILEDEKDHRVSRLSLSDYGHGKICVEVKLKFGKAGRMARPVNEDLLNDIFEEGLRKAWNERGLDDAREFLTTLPLEPITICPSLTKMSPLLAKGQRRLEDLRAGIIIKKDEQRQTVVESPNGTKLTLLERLRAKQLHNSTLPPPPSKAELARKAALARIDEVVAVLSILSTSSSVGQSRVSFTLPTVLGKLRDSFKTPMSKEEADLCVRILGSDIAPEWVRLVKMGKVEALVVNREEKPRDEEIRERVKRAV